MVLKVGLGPVTSGVALLFLDRWLGGARGDALAHRITHWGGLAVVVAAALLALAASQVPRENFRPLLMAAAVLNMLPVLLGMVAAMRAAKLGDPLARWMLVALVCLALGVGGLYAHALGPPGLGLLAQLLTAVLVVTYFLMASVLGLLRNRHNRQLARLSRLQVGADPVTGLLTGSGLLAEVEHVFWRSGRRQGECTVVCLYLGNLYELAESAGRGVEQQIQLTLAARIRRAAGFRCVVGLYQPRCFVVVLSTDKYAAPVSETVAYLQAMATEPLTVLDEHQVRHVFKPRVGVGVISNAPAHVKPMEVLHEAERLAMERMPSPDSHEARAAVTEHEIVTAPQPLA
jgi:GGDEF domain-containing protein